jgi:hypothetical protein
MKISASDYDKPLNGAIAEDSFEFLRDTLCDLRV